MLACCFGTGWVLEVEEDGVVKVSELSYEVCLFGAIESALL